MDYFVIEAEIVFQSAKLRFDHISVATAVQLNVLAATSGGCDGGSRGALKDQNIGGL